MSNVISLSKGEVINLTKMPAIDLSKGGKGLQKVMIGLGWDPVRKGQTQEKRGFFSSLFSSGSSNSSAPGEDIDCDAFAVALTNNAIASNDDIIYFGHLSKDDGSIRHTGDNLTGDGDGDDEQIIIDLSRVKCDTIIIGVNIYRGRERGQDFSKLENAFVRIEDMNTGMELCRYTLDSQFANYVTVHFGTLTKINNEWNFEATGAPSDANSISEFCNRLR